jgi:putative sigma-54 modulation protein
MTKHRRTEPLKVTVTGRNMAVTDALDEYASEKVGHLERYLDRLAGIAVVLGTENARRPSERYTAEATAIIKGRTVRAQVADANMYAAIDAVTDKMHQQLTRLKERTRDHKRGDSPEIVGTDVESGIVLPLDVDEDGDDEQEPRIVRTKQFLLKPMFSDEAIEELEALDHEFFVFLNAENEQVSVIYKRRDGNFGLIEPAFD